MNAIGYEDREKVYKAALEEWGIKAQSIMAIEEMSELTKEICKTFRGFTTKESMADEIADVTIMLEQLRIAYDINNEVCQHMDAKIERLKGRVFVSQQKRRNQDGEKQKQDT